MTKRLTCSVGIFAFNEAKNIETLLRSVITQRTKTVIINEILVIISGSTDHTYALVKKIQKKDKRIKIIQQITREGKASAVNLFIQHARHDILVIMGGDLRLTPFVIERLVSKFANSEVGMTGARPVPLNDINDGLSGFAGHLLWELHHQISLQSPKMGEVVAFRKIFKRIPTISSVDEANIEPLIRGQGYSILYIPHAIVYNKAPETIPDFVKQRRRIFSGHLAVKYEQSYEVATLHSMLILQSLVRFLIRHKSIKYFLYSPLVIGIETYSRLLGWWDYHIVKKRYTVWEMVESTKKLDK